MYFFYSEKTIVYLPFKSSCTVYITIDQAKIYYLFQLCFINFTKMNTLFRTIHHQPSVALEINYLKPTGYSQQLCPGSGIYSSSTLLYSNKHPLLAQICSKSLMDIPGQRMNKTFNDIGRNKFKNLKIKIPIMKLTCTVL